MPAIDIDDFRAEFSDDGIGLPIIFLPGLVGSRHWFCYQSSGLSDRYRVVCPELRRGRGRGLGLDRFAEDTNRLIERLRLGVVVLVGHELGAMIALKLAASHPEHCVALAVTSAAPNYCAFSEDELRRVLAPGEIRVEGVISRLRSLLRAPKPVVETEAGSPDYLAAHCTHLDRAALRSRVEIMRESDLEAVFPEITVPTLIIAGADEEPRILAGSQEIERRIIDSTVEILEGADHFCFYSRHDLFNAALHEFVARVVPSI